MAKDQKPQVFGWLALLDNSGRAALAVAWVALVLQGTQDLASVTKADPALPVAEPRWEGYAGGTVVTDQLRVAASGFEMATPVLPPSEPDEE